METAGEAGKVPGRWPIGSRARIVHGVALALALAAGFPLVFGACAALGVDPERIFAGDGTSFVALACFSVYRVGLVGIVGLYLIGEVKPQQLGWTNDRPVLSLGLGALCGLVAVGLTVALALASGSDLHSVGSTVFGFTLEQRLLFLMVACDAAFVEESLFRGYLQPALVQRLGFAGGLVATAAIFAVYHLNFRPLGLLSKLVLGLAFGLMRGRDRPLWVSGIAHGMLWVVVGTL